MIITTKYCVKIDKAEDIRFHLEKAIYEAKNCRMGPVLIDVPDDIQRKIINNSGLQLMSNLNCNLLITRRMLIFHYDLICMNSCTKGFDIFKVLKRKIILE